MGVLASALGRRHPFNSWDRLCIVGWRLGTRIPDEELSGLSPASRRLLLFALCYLCPVGIAVVLFFGLRA